MIFELLLSIAASVRASLMTYHAVLLLGKLQAAADILLEVVLAVEGMTCSACEHTVKAALEHVKPLAVQPVSVVEVLNVSHVTGSATVVVRTGSDDIDTAAESADSRHTKLPVVLRGSERLTAALDAVGFDAHVLSYKNISTDGHSSTDVAAGADNTW
jgi:copper chaperone CopZ